MPFKRRLLTRTLPFLFLGLLAFILYLIFFIDVGEMVEIIKQISIPLYILSLFATTAEMFFFALAWQHFLTTLSAEIPLKKAFMYSWVSNFIDLLVPAESVSGEIARVYFVARDGIDVGKAVASVIIQRIVGMLFIILGLVIGISPLLIAQTYLSGIIKSLIILVVSVTLVFLLTIFILCFKENWTQSLIDKIFVLAKRVTRGRWSLERWREKTRRDIVAFYDSIRFFRKNPRKSVLPIVFSFSAWLYGILVYYLVFLALGYNDLDWTVLLTVYSLIITLKSIPIGVPAEVGVTEIAMVTLFGAFNVPLHVSAVATVLIRIVTVWFRFAIGFCAVQWLGIKTLTASGAL